jgi:hypothetical protein
MKFEEKIMEEFNRVLTVEDNGREESGAFNELIDIGSNE